MDFLFASPPKTPKDLPSMTYYPIFDRRWQTSTKEEKPKTSPHSGKAKTTKVRSKNVTRAKPYTRKQLFKSNDQYFLDLGQKDFDPQRCKVCNMIFTMGELVDEKTHEEYHDMFINSLKYREWKNEDIVATFEDGRILRVLPSSPHFMHKKIDELFKVADLELNINQDLKSTIKSTSMYYIYISLASKRIAGFVDVVRVHSANTLLSEEPLTASTDDVPAECGVARIWIHPKFRRKGIATKLLDTVRHNVIPDKMVNKEKLAFSDPTNMGKDFAVKYTQNDHFLIYTHSHVIE